MRYAVVSDIHANWQAWTATLLDIRSVEADRIICLGDLVGYGPNPVEVLQSVHANVNFLVLGNHDAVVAGILDAALFNASARRIIAWTRERLNRHAVHFLRGLPLVLDGDTFRCVHGEFSEPAAFRYVIDPADAMPSWRAADEQLLFVGHSHQPGLFLLGESRTPRGVEAQDFELEPEKRYLVNVGSVGQPRDGEARASYCLYDTEARAVFWRRIPFDLDAYREALDRAGIDAAASYFLRHDPRRGRPPLREILNFSPPADAAQGARQAVEVQRLAELERRLSRWKGRFAGAVAAAAVVLLAGGAVWWRDHTRALDLPDPAAAGPPADATTSAPGVNVLRMPEVSAAVGAGAGIPGWTVHLGDRRRQRVEAVAATGGEPVFRLTSRTLRDGMGLASAPVRVTARTPLHAEALFAKSPDFSGPVALVVSLERRRADGTPEWVEQFLVKEPNEPRREGLLARVTADVPAGGTAVRFQVRGRFRGTVEVRRPALWRGGDREGRGASDDDA